MALALNNNTPDVENRYATGGGHGVWTTGEQGVVVYLPYIRGTGLSRDTPTIVIGLFRRFLLQVSKFRKDERRACARQGPKSI